MGRAKQSFLKNCTDTNCHYCGVLITKENHSIDHKHPVSKGGDRYDLKNFVLACQSCNNAKGDYEYDYFVQNFNKIISGKLTKKVDYDQLSARDKKFHDINHAKELSACFKAGVFEPKEQIEIKKYRTPSVSFIRLGPKSISLNYSEGLESGLEENIKLKVFKVIAKFGIPAKNF